MKMEENIAAIVSGEDMEDVVRSTEERTCCVTGHRNIPADKLEFVEQELRREIDRAVRGGYTYFISGFAEGADQIFARIVTELMKDNDKIFLEAAIPYRNRLKRLLQNPETKSLLLSCSAIGVHSEEYSSGCYMKRNRFMVRMSGRVIAVHDGREKGGTVQTLRFAHVHEKEARMISI